MASLPAARVGDDIAHSHAGLGMALGVGLGVLAGVVLVGATIATGGAALAVVAAVGGAAAMTSAGGLGGGYIGEGSMGAPCGKFVTGSADVFVNDRPATFTFGSTASCSSDSGAQALATGSSSVFINFGMAGRRDEKLACSAKSVPQVSPNVFIGGDSTQDRRVAITPEIPAWATTSLQILGVAGALLALPYAVVMVGVPGIVISGALGAVGGEYGAQGGHALGEALGLSEAGIRTLEVLGGTLGGMAGGAAGGRVSAPRFGTPANVRAAVNRMPPKFQAQYASAKATGFRKPDFGKPGARKIALQPRYPPNNGGVGAPKVTRLPNGQKLDRYGGEHGSFMSNAGDKFEQRALPGQAGTANKYTTQKGLDGKGLLVEESEIAPWFDQPGGGTQYKLIDPAGRNPKYSVELAKKQQHLRDGH